MSRKVYETSKSGTSWLEPARLCAVWLGLLILVSSIGCWSRSSSIPPASAASETEVELPPIAQTAEGDDVTAPATDKPLDDTASDVTASNPVTEPESALPAVDPVKVPDGVWTTQRVIALTSRGPLAIDLLMRVGAEDLGTASERAVQPIVMQLLEQLGEEATWSKLLELPLVKSGWIGNLVAQEDQTSQLISMYDKNQDLKVQPDELPEFLTRGLSRSAVFSIADAGVETGEDGLATSFGMLDRNQDNVLDQDELNDCPAALAQLDFNADAQISLEELTPTTASTRMARMSGASMLRTQSMIHVSAADSGKVANDELERQIKRKVNDVLEYYSFLGFVEREQWPGWTDQQWENLDKNADRRIDKRELVTIFTMVPMAKVAVSWPSVGDITPTSEPVWYFESDQKDWSFDSSANSGVLGCDAGNILINLEDGLAGSASQLLRTQLNQSLSNAAIRQFLTQRLQLQDSALDVANPDGDDTISDAEFQAVWHWLTARSNGRLQGSWQVSARPWFQLIDRDHNSAISEVELYSAAATFAAMDMNKDTLIDSGELPLVARLTLSRQDNRLQLPAFSQPGNAPREVLPDNDWFDAMDTSRDGSISRAEFLGKSDTFQQYDRNSDGFIARPEVY